MKTTSDKEGLKELPSFQTTPGMDRYIEKITKNMNQNKELDHDFLTTLIVSPLSLLSDIQEGTSGNFKLVKERIEAGTQVTVVSWRNMLMMGYKATKIELPYRRIVHKLYKEGQLLMSDSPQEMFLQKDMMDRAKGRVLTSGLGLSLFTHMAMNKDEVTEIVVVEKEPDVIDLIKLDHPKVTVLCEDIWGFLRTTKDVNFDYIYIDIHYRTGAFEYINTVLPMKKILEKRFPGIPADFWGEEEMKTQFDENHPNELKRKVANYSFNELTPQVKEKLRKLEEDDVEGAPLQLKNVQKMWDGSDIMGRIYFLNRIGM